MKRILVLFAVLVASTLGLSLHQYRKFNDGRLHVVFCDVGQGDAVFIRTPGGFDLLYDGGPDREVLGCLSEHMPFWDRTIDLVLLSHPHADHLIGLISVLKRYTVLAFDTESLRNETAMYAALHDLLNKQRTAVRYVLAGDRYQTKDGVILTVRGPTKRYLKETSPGGLIGERKEFASVILHLKYKNFDVLLTGDSQVPGIQDALGKDVRLDGLEVIHVPHHGSRTGLNEQVVTALSPKLAAISVGKNNYGHPNKDILELLRRNGAEVFRTDETGNIEIISDGEKWWVKSR